MASFQAKIWGKTLRKSENKKLSFCFVPTQRVIENSLKNCKKIQKIKKNTVIASFQAKIGWKWPRNRENKNYRFVLFLRDA